MPPTADISAITVHLDDLLEAQGMTLTELADRVGLTLANLSILKTGKARAIRFATLASLCAELGCQPGDLLRYEPEQPEQGEQGA
jgi:putative transcriptional regulator